MTSQEKSNYLILRLAPIVLTSGSNYNCLNYNFYNLKGNASNENIYYVGIAIKNLVGDSGLLYAYRIKPYYLLD